MPKEGISVLRTGAPGSAIWLPSASLGQLTDTVYTLYNIRHKVEAIL